ncbi:2-phospho-L-lactate guanylyltransferase [Micromonospora musae]|uniref:Phosphoenolpyruvate guanylyltransferase n=1 Tax=Micromonospora musae TaxID=1894970 RepID=A0ABX9R965_9ACTN|nr:2-phospho-L-lactate guanylyltransferase [Micromonospora musae]
MPAPPWCGPARVPTTSWQDCGVSQPKWALVVPAKPLTAAKSRLRGALPGVPHEELALALAADTVRAARACPLVADVLLVTDDVRVGALARKLGARVLPDLPAAGLNAAFSYGADIAGPGWVAGLTADLPALRPAELADALRVAQDGPPVRRYVADAPGDGTVLLTAPPGLALEPRFGVRSAAAHAASGALPMTGGWPSLRRDVDTPADLAAAARLGLGPRTAALTVDHAAAAG